MSAQPDLEQLYRTMCRIRFVESAAADLWRAGRIPGEMHLGIGEEAVAAGVVAHLGDGDAMSVDHRSTPPFVARGVDPEAILRECLGDEHGLDGGRAGHMHLMSRRHLAAASGIVGAAGPVACGFGLAAQVGGRGRVAVAFFGDGAVNQGHLMESFNLAAAWRLPIVFVCKDNRWAINTRTRTTTGGTLEQRARGFGLPVTSVDGTDVVAVWRAAGRAVRRARRGGGPTFLVARVKRSEGHFLGDRLVEIATHPERLRAELGPIAAAVRADAGAPMAGRLRSLAALNRTIGMAALERYRRDPLARARRGLPARVAAVIEEEERAEIFVAFERAQTELVFADA
jgi:pyruvate dehydrogenase E1 component alpha subunit